MNYIKQLRAFDDWVNRNQCSASAQLLYYKLLSINNTVAWVEWFSRSNPSLMGMMNASENTVIKARNELKQKELIEFVSGKKRCQLTKYKIIQLYKEDKVSESDTKTDTKKDKVSKFDTKTDTKQCSVSEFDTQPDTQPDTQTDTQPDTQTADITKYINLNNKHNNITPLPPKINFAEFVSMTNVEHSALVTEFGEEITGQLIEILDNYKGACGKQYKSDYRAIKTWVIDRYNEEKAKKNKASPVAKETRQQLYARLIAEAKERDRRRNGFDRGDGNGIIDISCT